MMLIYLYHEEGLAREYDQSWLVNEVVYFIPAKVIKN